MGVAGLPSCGQQVPGFWRLLCTLTPQESQVSGGGRLGISLAQGCLQTVGRAGAICPLPHRPKRGQLGEGCGIKEAGVKLVCQFCEGLEGWWVILKT